MFSHDHPALGSVGGWFYQALGGINQASGGEGYRHLRIAPLIVEGLDWASATVDTMRGTVSCSWNHPVGGTTVEVTIPVNSNAEVVIPLDPEMTEMTLREGDHVIWQNGKYVSGDEGMTGAREEGGRITLSVGSGHYRFQLTGK
jgi:alpha-L-rhamnosidase